MPPTDAFHGSPTACPVRRRRRRITPGIAAAVALVLILVLPPAGAGAAAPGAVVDLTWGISRSDMNREVAALRDAHVKWVRMNLPWNTIERNGPRRFDRRFVADVDYAVARVRALGIHIVMPIADGVPAWASADPAARRRGARRRWNIHYRPRRFEDYGRFVGWAARHYGHLGVHSYEIWNEPNLAAFWPSGPSPRAYVQMLRAAYPAIKRADRASTVFLGGLADNDTDFLKAIYDGGGRRFFDAVSDHVYPHGDPKQCAREPDGTWSRESLCAIGDVRRVMTDHGDGAKPIWLTEIGWSTGGANRVTPTQQALYLVSALRRLDADFPWLATAMIYNLRDDYWLHDAPQSAEANFGLLRTDFSPKPAYEAVSDYIWMASLVGALDQLVASVPAFS